MTVTKTPFTFIVRERISLLISHRKLSRTKSTQFFKIFAFYTTYLTVHHWFWLYYATGKTRTCCLRWTAGTCSWTRWGERVRTTPRSATCTSTMSSHASRMSARTTCVCLRRWGPVQVNMDPVSCHCCHVKYYTLIYKQNLDAVIFIL